MKDHVEEKRYLGRLYGPIEDEIARIREAAKDLAEPYLDTHGWDGDYLVVKGWRPMTERELETAKKRRAASRAANKAKKEKAEAAERAVFERLAKKYGG